ncbi:MAG: hypothetical protein OXL68_02855 [Paracoccaceae bacterium]|nr:hypothetical protein [Paracoccaceae bacterium]
MRLDRLLGRRAKARHGDWKRRFRKRINKLAIRVRNRVDDLHRRVTDDLVQAFDVILLPAFETKEMSAKSDRKITSKTVRSMLGLAHYRFRQKLEWMCRKYGKRLVIANEAYTSKTRSWDGFVDRHLGGTRTDSDGSIAVERDINDVRGNMLRALYGDPGRFQAADADDALVAESIKCCTTRKEHRRRLNAQTQFTKGSCNDIDGLRFNLLVIPDAGSVQPAVRNGQASA